ASPALQKRIDTPTFGTLPFLAVFSWFQRGLRTLGAKLVGKTPGRVFPSMDGEGLGLPNRRFCCA
ncbi:hypothetical protein, partial [Eggerthella lenta]|uniref:hypothetical protein n=1 Tax=Eggerthella lenta TaxID=84112 RepID=UPI001D071A74